MISLLQCIVETGRFTLVSWLETGRHGRCGLSF